MGTLSSELGPIVNRVARGPRVYADANIPARLVAFMRQALVWDVLFVLEHADLRRAPDVEHYRLARALGRTIVTLDRDYADDRRFPPEESGGVIIVSSPDERALARLFRRIDQVIFRGRRRVRCGPDDAPPLAGQKLHANPDWPSGGAPGGTQGRPMSPR